MLELALLGHPQIRLDGESLSIPSKKSQALLYFLALSERPHSRTALAGLLWGGKRESDGRRNLRVELTKLRRILPGYLVVTHTTVGFDHAQPYRLDVAELRAIAMDPLFNIAHSKRTVALVRGELLEDLQLQDAREFEAWLITEQEECRQLHLSLLQAIIGQCQQSHNFQEALSYSRQLLAMEPWREESHRLVIRLLDQSGQRSAALAQYEKCRQILAQELGVEPSPETRQLMEEIKAGRLESHAAPVAVVAVRSAGHNLPTATTTFIGRGEEQAKIRELLSRPECRLLTLLGPGGIGKSRLALEVGRSWVTNPEPLFAGGVYYVPLAEARSEAALISAITQALDISLTGVNSAKEQLLNNLKDRQLLLILDNLEQLVEHSGFLVDLLAAAGKLKCLVTSRHRLPLLESWNYDLPGLDIPADGAEDEATDYSAIQLFIERARRLDLGFNISAEKIDIVRICRLLDGLPLGIELAAAWVRGFSCKEIADRISRDLDLLESTSPSLPERQWSLRAAFTHSWDLLSPEEQGGLARLSIFHGGFSRQAAEVVAGAGRRLILNLVDKSLLRRSPNDRYALHQVLGQLAGEKVPPGEVGQLRSEHAAYFVHFLRRRETGQGEIMTQVVVDEISADLENIQAAWDYSVEAADSDFLDLGTDSLANYYANRSTFREGADQFGRAAAVVEEGTPVWARLRQRQAQFFFRLGRNQEALNLGKSVLPVLEAGDNHLEMARCLLTMGNAVRDMGDYGTAGGYYQHSATLFAGENDQLGIAAVENNLGVLRFYQENLTGAIDHFEAAMAARQAAGVKDTTLELGNIGLCLGELGRYEEAAEYLEKSLALSLQFDARLTSGLSHHNLGNARRNLGQHQVSAGHLEESVRIFRELGSRDALAAALADLASTYLELGQFSEAEAALLEGLELERALKRPRGIAYKHLGLGNLRLEQGDLDKACSQFNQVINIAGTDHGYSLVHGALIGLAVIKAQYGDLESAATIFEAISASEHSGAETREQITAWRDRLDLADNPDSTTESLTVEEMILMLRG